MRVATVAGRATVLTEANSLDVHHASGGRFPADPAGLFEQWAEFVAWAPAVDPSDFGPPVDSRALGAPSPAPRQIFAVGLNYRDHVAETGQTPPAAPSIFTKFVTSLTGPSAQLVLPSDSVDWEVELVAIIGRVAKDVTEAEAWNYVAGLTVGQDYSERVVQMAGSPPQFSLGKSYPGFSPTGPWLVTPDEFADPDDLALDCTVNGKTMQKSRTSELLFSVRQLVAYLSSITPLLPGDIIFTGTPAGVGMGRTPKIYLRPGDEVVSTIEGIGSLHQRAVEATSQKGKRDREQRAC
jgi:2-keto-4-pentenoate hydratase/2-oxohepta-3-ene-1,7-dioic acid hydratase in catechol pathway